MNLSPIFNIIIFSIRPRTFRVPVVLATPRVAQASPGDVHDATRRRTPTRHSCPWRTWAARRTTCRCWEEIRTRRWELTREGRASPHTTTTIRYIQSRSKIQTFEYRKHLKTSFLGVQYSNGRPFKNWTIWSLTYFWVFRSLLYSHDSKSECRNTRYNWKQNKSAVQF